MGLRRFIKCMWSVFLLVNMFRYWIIINWFQACTPIFCYGEWNFFFTVVVNPFTRELNIYYNLFITLLLGSKAETVSLKTTVISKQKCIDNTKRWWPFFYIIYTLLGSIFKPCYIQNCVLTNSVIKGFLCILDRLACPLYRFPLRCKLWPCCVFCGVA